MNGFSSERMSGVLSRVVADTGDRTGELIGLEHEELQRLCAISKKLGGADRALIRRIFGEKRGIIAFLHAVRFLSDGAAEKLSDACALLPSLGEGLRASYNAELTLSRIYAAEAGRAETEYLRKRLVSLSDGARKNAEHIMRLAEKYVK